MYRHQFEEKILERHPELTKVNLKLLKIEQLEQLQIKYQVTLSAADYVKICAERNERASVNQNVNRQNFALKQKNKSLVKKLEQLSEDFLNLDKSEIINAGKWLFNALSKTGEARKSHLLEKDLVHKDNYNETLEDLKQVIKEQKEGLEKQAKLAKETIQSLEKKNDELKNKLRNIEKYIINNNGLNEWNKIRKYFGE